MSRLKRQVVSALVRLYPSRWRREYGLELADVLVNRRLGVTAVLDVLWNSVRQQLRWGEPWLILGVPCLAMNLLLNVWNILYPWPYATDSLGTRPAHWVSLAVLLTLGWWTVVRDPVHGRGGWAAVKAALLATWPLSALGILAGLGVLKIITLGPGDVPTTFHEHGFAMTFYDHTRLTPYWFPLFMIPILDLPFAALGGWVGGLLGRGYLWWRARPAGR